MNWMKKRFSFLTDEQIKELNETLIAHMKNKEADEQIEELNGMWIALIRNKKTNDWKIIRKPNGMILAHGNPIFVQTEAMELHPEIEENQNGKNIMYCHICDNLRNKKIL